MRNASERPAGDPGPVRQRSAVTEHVHAVHPEPDVVQLLTPEGQRVRGGEYDLEISDDEIAGLYRDLVLARRFDTEAIALQRQGELGLWASLLGQEAAQVGAGRALRRHDMAFPTYREHAVALCRDVDPLVLLGLFRGTNLGGFDPREHNFNLYTIVIGAQTLHATGYAMGVVRDGAVGTGDPDRDTAVLAFFGDGASSQGDVNEAFVWAAAGNLPVVFFCQNNQWAISEPVERQSRVPLYQRASGFGFPGVRVDGNDVLACLSVTRKALDDARSAQGPTLIEAFTYRMNPHTTSDDPTRYRLGDETETWKLKDPIERVRAYLTREAKLPSEFFEGIEAESLKLAEHIRSGCRALPNPTPHSLFDHVHVELPDELREQRDEFAAFIESVGA
ncbi:MAG: thiamine pyrophosphate-dependent dehydrogenase E1 component subunit alpha [Jatrophihabitans sp.]|uniref:thiamine pyrophosphate-dependent dehydrogenase E1 component subunit alpha n=1 Tax=Jatrophihabitans sp. TaxID=1932789 RepID=UPI003F7FAA58